MSTTVFFRSAGASNTSNKPTEQSSGRLDVALKTGAASTWRDRRLDTSRGAGVSTDTENTVTGPTSGIEVGFSQSALVPWYWITPPIDQDVTISGSVSVNLWGSESNMSANASLAIVIQRVDSQLNFTTIASSTAVGVELGLSSAVRTASLTPTSTAMKRGDRIRARVLFDDAGTMATGFTASFDFDGATASASGDSFLTFTETFGFLTTDPTGTKVHFTDTTSAVATASVDKEIWTSVGAGATTDVTNTVTGETSGVQVTDTAGGTVSDWWTRPLTAFTLTAPVLTKLYELVSADANAEIRAEIAITDNDGSNPVVWGTAASGTESSTSSTARQFYVCGADTAVSDGQRLRVRLYVDDATQGGAMVTGKTHTFNFGAALDATSDSQLIFNNTLTESSGTASIPFLVVARTRV